jgi:hypothetical protein
MTPRWDPAMTSIHSSPATGAALRMTWRTRSAATGTLEYDPNLFSCVSQAYMVHVMNVRRLSDPFLRCVTFSSVYVAILAATS